MHLHAASSRHGCCANPNRRALGTDLAQEQREWRVEPEAFKHDGVQVRRRPPSSRALIIGDDGAIVVAAASYYLVA